MNATTNPRLEALLRSQQEAQEEAQKYASKIEDLLVKEYATTDGELLAIQKKIKVAKDKQHRHRLVMARKKYSVRVRSEQIAAIKAEIAKMETADQGLSEKLTALMDQYEAARGRIASRVRKEIEKQKPADAAKR